MTQTRLCWILFFFNDTATTEIYTLSLHDALPICVAARTNGPTSQRRASPATTSRSPAHSSNSSRLPSAKQRSEEHTSELQSQSNLVCRLLLEKKTITTDVCLLHWRVVLSLPILYF